MEIPQSSTSGKLLLFEKDCTIYTDQYLLTNLIHRLLDKPIPEEILCIRIKDDKEIFPSNMFPNIINLEHQIDIDPPVEE